MKKRKSILCVVLHLNLCTTTQCIRSSPNKILNAIKNKHQQLLSHSSKNPDHTSDMNDTPDTFEFPPHPAQNRILASSGKRFPSGLNFVDFERGTMHHHLRMHQERRKLEISKHKNITMTSNDGDHKTETTQHDSVSGLKDEDNDKDDEPIKKKKEDSGWWERITEVPDPTYSHLGIPSNRRSLSSTLYISQSPEAEPKVKPSKQSNVVEDLRTKEISGDFDDLKNLTEAHDLDEDITNNVQNENNQSNNDKLVDQLPDFEDNAGEIDKQSKDEKEHDDSNEDSNSHKGKTKEWMIVSGGFTDEDWITFPVWAYDLSSYHDTNSGTWIPLHVISMDEHEELNTNPTNQANSNMSFHTSAETNKITSNENESEIIGGQKTTPKNNEPTGRVGHLTAVNDGYLYVFGGLTYNKRRFFVDDELILWRAKIDHILTSATNDEGTGHNADDESPTSLDEDPLPKEKDNGPRLNWEIIKPNIKGPVHQSIVKKLPRGEAQGSVHDRIEIGEDGQEYNKSRWIIHGGLHTRSSSSSPSIYNQSGSDDIPLADVWSYDFETNEFELLDAGDCFDVMECLTTPIARTAHAGTILGDTLVIYGGMTTVTKKAYDDKSRVETWEMLDDVWSFDLNTLIWKKWNISPLLGRSYHSLVSWNAVVPGKVDNNDKPNADDDDVAEKVIKRIKDIDGLLDLEKEEDGRARGSIICYGGFRTYETLPGDSIAFVFSDTIIAHPPREVEPYDPLHQESPESFWYKVQLPPGSPEAVAHRLEHTSIIDSSGTLLVWGGRFRTVNKISGMWSLNLFGPHSKVQLKVADPDGLDEYETQLETLHLLVAMLLFMSVIFTAMYGSLRRRAEERGQTNEGPSFLGRRVRGAAQEIIDSIPVKTFGRNCLKSKERNIQLHETTDQTISGESSDCVERQCSSSLNEDDQNNEECECCPICLVEYENGDQIRILPCNHEFHKDCVDPWLSKNSSCPACRHSLFDTKSTCQNVETNENNDDFADDQNLNSSSLSLGSRAANFVDLSMSEYTNHFGLGRRRRMHASRRWFGAFRRHDAGHVIITDGSESNGVEGQHYISSLELTEEVPMDAQGNESTQTNNTNRILRPQIGRVDLRRTAQTAGESRASSLSLPLRADSAIV